MLVLQVLSLTIPFLFVIVILLIKNNEKRQQQQLQADVYFKAVEKGQSSPIDLKNLFGEPQKKRNPLSTGIILLFAGIGISLTLWLMSVIFTSLDSNAANALFSIAPVGILPFMVGIAYVIIHLKKKKKDIKEDAK
jgi:hypothetical protein